MRKLLDRPSGGVIFTTLQKFSPETGTEHPVLTDRRNVIVIADEAHRSQHGLDARVQAKTGEITTASRSTCATPCLTPPSSASPVRPSRRGT
jgi:type I site-specific restriction-modification system R (restriction) subunit